MHALYQTLTIAIKELRELLRRPALIVTLIFGPLAIMLLFGIGTKNVVEPPRAVVVLPPGEGEPPLLAAHREAFEHFLNVVEYTEDEARARRLLAEDRIDAVVILPSAPRETIAAGRQAALRVLYSEINPARRQLVPDFVRVLVGDLNRQLFLENAGAGQARLREVSRDLDPILRALELAEQAAARGDEAEARRQREAARRALAALVAPPAGGEGEASGMALAEARERLQAAERRLAGAGVPPPPPDAAERARLAETRRELLALDAALERLATVSPEVIYEPVTARTTDLTPLKADIITYYGPAILALIVQHAAVSLGALALVRERLSGAFALFIVAPAKSLHLLLGKYLAYLVFVLTIGAAMLGVLLSPLLGIPLAGSAWRLAGALLLLTLASIGLGFVLSLLAASERQAVQFAMLSLLAVVFFSGIALPLDALQQPALTLSYLLPATYATDLLQDIMLLGLPGDRRFFLALAGMAAALFLAALALLRWRTKPS